MSKVKAGLVSIVVPSYNYGHYLVQRMESLLHQTYQNFEIVVIDDCSSDNSVDILRQYESHPKVRVLVREQNGGWVKVNNQGVEISSGEFILFAQCDDDCDPHMIERLVNAMKSHPSAGITYCRSLLVDEDDKPLGDDFEGRERAFRTRCAEDTLISGAEMSRFLLHSCVIPNLSAALIRRHCFSEIGDFTSAYRVCGDWDWFFRISSRFDVAYVSEPLNRFRQHGNTIRSSTKGRAMYEEYFRLLLGQIRALELSFSERCRFRTHVIYLWGTHLFAQPWVGLRNFPYHLSRIFRLDPLTLLFFLPGLVSCLLKGARKIFGKMHVA